MTLRDRITAALDVMSPNFPEAGGIAPVSIAEAAEQDRQFFGALPSYTWQTPWLGDQFEQLYPRAAALVPTVNACITRIANDIAGLPLKFTIPGKGNRRSAVPDKHWVVALFQDGNPQYSGFEVVRDISAGLDTVGNSLMWAEVPEGAKVPQALWHVPAHLAPPIPGPNRSIRGYYYWPMVRMFDAADVTPFRYWNPNWNPLLPAPWGLSPLSAARLAFEARNRQGQWQKQMYERGAQVAGVWQTDIETSIGMTEEWVKNVQKQMLATGGGVENAFMPVIVPGMKQAAKPLNPKDMAFLEMVAQNDADILRVYHIPPVIMGIKEGGGLSDAGAKADLLLYAQLCLGERAQLIGRVITDQFLRRWAPGMKCEVDLSGQFAMAGAALEQAEAIAKLTNRAVYTLNEGRDALDMDPADDPHADEYLVPFQQILSADLGADIRVNPSAVPPEAPKQDQPPDGAEAPAKSQKQRSNLARWARRHDDMLRYQRPIYQFVHARFERQRETVMAGVERDYGHLGRGDAKALARRGMRLMPADAWIPQGEDEAKAQALYNRIIAERGVAAAAEVAAEVSEAIMVARVAAQVRQRAGFLISQIDDTTRAEVAEAIAQAIESGASYGEMVSAVDAVFAGRLSDAEMIARTETTWAYNLASLTAWNESGVTFKSWLTAHDEKVRETHQLCEDEGNIPMDAVFSNGLAYPGDPSGEAGEVINCRCVLQPEFGESTDVGRGDVTDDEESMARRNGHGRFVGILYGGKR